MADCRDLLGLRVASTASQRAYEVPWVDRRASCLAEEVPQRLLLSQPCCQKHVLELHWHLFQLPQPQQSLADLLLLQMRSLK